jgi:O-antigen ligase
LAYLGIAPLYISELTLVLGCVTILLLAVFRGHLYIGAVMHFGALCLLLFMVWGAMRTLPFFKVYGMDSLRDGVIWGYGIFAFSVALLVSPQSFARLLGAYSRFAPGILLGLVASYVLMKTFDLPILPGSPVSIINLKSGDAGVHLGGVGAFMLLRLDRMYGKPFPKWLMWVMWVLWGVAWLLYGSIGRSGMMSALLGLFVVLLLRPKLAGWVRPAILIAVLLLGLFFVEVTGIYQTSTNSRRQLSVEQITTNFTSLFGGRSRGDQENTIQWRLSWWKKIVGYTLEGDYFWTGKGFGINLAIDDGFPSPANTAPNRHPHNVTMNILARAGLPGLVLWLGFLLTFGVRLLQATRRHGIAGKTAIWLLAYWLAFLFNAQTDVFFENPMGGIWFWSIVGMSWVLIYRVPRWQPATIEPTISTTISTTIAAPSAAYGLAQSTPQQS